MSGPLLQNMAQATGAVQTAGAKITRKDDAEKGIKFLAGDDSCNEADAIELANKLREAMK